MNIINIINVILYLLNHGKTSAKKLADKLNLSTRTIYRYISKISCCNIPITTYTGKNGGIEILNTFSLSKMYLTCEEKNYLLDALKLFNTTDNSRATLNQTIYTKINIL